MTTEYTHLPQLKSPAEMQVDYEQHKLNKYNTLLRYHLDLQKDPTLYPRFFRIPLKPGIHRTPHDEPPYSELAISTIASLVLGGVFGLAGSFFQVGNFPNHHVLDHMKPTVAQQFRFNGRFVKEKVKAGKVWAKIGILFTLADAAFLAYYDPQFPVYHQVVASYAAGVALGFRRGPKAANLSGLGFVAFTYAFHLLTDMMPDMAFMGDQYADIDPQRPPGVPPTWKPYYETFPLMPRDQRVEFRREKRSEAAFLQQQQQQMQMQQMGMGMGGPPPGAEEGGMPGMMPGAAI